MQFSRAFFPLRLTLLLLFTQQDGAMHTLHHALTEQDKHSSHSSAYSSLSFAVIAIPSRTVRLNTFAFRSNQLLIAVTRGPPGLL
ncbi:MAG: hypothetical protein Q8K74_10420 [Candidatus Nitrotoga sp.]|nr:hypothetical protein [Candidatus Nitrotoga sp.]MDO9447837.1 hypothetical protein [Candidatus Nitrotoga sp.]MDP1856438.1 hypothetical protein [Candidatus Nitrotoga sp.]MDP3496201.1 hypothetical protein [Candidatus Nitrotoga sp.]